MTDEALAGAQSTPSVFCKIHALWTVVAILLFLAIASFQSWRLIHRLCEPEIQTTDSERGACTLNDFRDATYYPAVAFRQQKNPYDPVGFVESYPVGDVFPPYLPMTLLLHLPLGFLPFRSAAIGYLLLTLAMTLVLAWLSLRLAGRNPTLGLVFFIASLILLSRPGQRNLSLGQCAVTVGVGLAIALLYVRKPFVGGLGLALASLKPTYGIPLVLLLLAQGHFKTAFVGAGLAGLLSFFAVFYLVSNAGGIQSIAESLLKSCAWAEERWVSDPVTSPGRIDVKSILGRILQFDPGIITEVVLFILLAGAGAWFLRRRRTSAPIERLGAIDIGIYVLVPLTCLFHQEYDLVLLVLPLVALWESSCESSLTRDRIFDRFLFILMTIPLMNYFQSATIQGWFGITSGSLAWRLLSSMNGLCILGALFLLCRSGLTTRAHTCTNSSPIG